MKNASADSSFHHLKEWGRDFAAGLSVFFVAIPLCLGIAHASGAPVLAGLVAGIVGGIIVGITSGAPLSVTGPSAGMATIVIYATQTLGKFEYVLVATVFAGLIQIVLGLLKAGNIAKFFPDCRDSRASHGNRDFAHLKTDSPPGRLRR